MRLKIEAKMCVNRVKGVSEVKKWNVKKSQRKESCNKTGCMEVDKRNQNEGCQVQKGISRKGEEATQVFSVTWGAGRLMLVSTAISPFVNEAAHCSYAGRLHFNTVCALFVSPTHLSSLPSKFSWLGTAAVQANLKLFLKDVGRKAGLLAVLARYCQSPVDINLFIAFLSCTIYYQENAEHHFRIRKSFCSGIKIINF